MDDIREKKLQKLKKDLYISDHEQDEEPALESDVSYEAVAFATDDDGSSGMRHSRRRKRVGVDYNESKRQKGWNSSNTSSGGNSSGGTSKRSSPEVSTNVEERVSLSSSTPEVTTKNEIDSEFPLSSSNSASNLASVFSLPETQQNLEITSNFIDQGFVRAICEKDMMKKLSLLGNNDHDKKDEEEIDNTEDSSFGAFNEEINTEIKHIYQNHANSLLNLKQIDILNSINSIDNEISRIKSLFKDFQKSQRWGSAEPALYPDVFTHEFENTAKTIQYEKKLLDSNLELFEKSLNVNLAVVHEQFNSSFLETRASMKQVLENKIAQLNNEFNSIAHKINGSYGSKLTSSKSTTQSEKSENDLNTISPSHSEQPLQLSHASSLSPNPLDILATCALDKT